MLVDASPRRITNIAAAGSVLYFAAYTSNNGTISNAEVLAVDIATGAPVGTPLSTTGAPAVWAVGNDVYASDYSASGTIWKLQAPAAPVAVVTGRNKPGAVTADATHVYWAEEVGSSTVVRRKAFANSTVEDVMTCASPRRLIVDATDLYCAPLQSSVLRAPKSGGQTVTIPVGSGYAVSSMVQDGTNLYVVNVYNYPQLWRVPMPDGPASLVKQVPEIGRYEGLAISPTYFYTVDSNYGVRRIHRTSLDVDRIYNALFVTRAPLLANGRLYFLANNPQLAGPNYVMHCVD